MILASLWDGGETELARLEVVKCRIVQRLYIVTTNNQHSEEHSISAQLSEV